MDQQIWINKKQFQLYAKTHTKIIDNCNQQKVKRAKTDQSQRIHHPRQERLGHQRDVNVFRQTNTATIQVCHDDIQLDKDTDRHRKHWWTNLNVNLKMNQSMKQRLWELLLLYYRAGKPSSLMFGREKLPLIKEIITIGSITPKSEFCYPLVLIHSKSQK